jgi:hypothetical protein
MPGFRLWCLGLDAVDELVGELRCQRAASLGCAIIVGGCDLLGLRCCCGNRTRRRCRNGRRNRRRHGSCRRRNRVCWDPRCGPRKAAVFRQIGGRCRPAYRRSRRWRGRARLYLGSQSARLVNYAARYRASLRVGTSVTEGTANFLVNRRMNKLQQMRWTRRGANLLLQVRCAVHNGTFGHGLCCLFEAAPSLEPPAAKTGDPHFLDTPFACDAPH